MPTEPTEYDARELLARAAATIEVADDAPLTLTGLPDPTSRRWPLLVAVAAAVVLVVGGGWVVAAQVGNGDKSNGPAAPTATDHAGLEHERTFSADRMPSVLGYTEAEARDLLQAGRGMDVRIRPRYDGCTPADTVIGADIAVGHAIRPGMKVTLTVAKPALIRGCMTALIGDQAWALARYARGLDRPPALAARVQLSFAEGGSQVASLSKSSEELADPSAWTVCGADACHSVIGAFAAMLSDPATWSYAGTPSLHVAMSGRCQGNMPWDAPRFQVWVEVPVDGAFCPSTSLSVGLDDRGRIAGVELRLPAAPEESEDLTEPELDANMQRLSAAQQFVAWARGDDRAPAFADRVRHLNGGFAPDWNTDPERRNGWSGCSGLGFPDCPIDPVGVIARYDGKVIATPGRSTCPDDDELPDEYAAAADDIVRLSVPEPASCRTAWAIELWINEAGEIYAVNQIGTLPLR